MGSVFNVKTSAAPAEGLRDLVINALNDRKANQIKVIDVTTLTEITDYMVNFEWGILTPYTIAC
ncbi:MAG: hypothetical protein CM1200mP9_11780 [Gammaproteobacteria bacterium]|nr:MAG: hypothetical protein CM1200mP9_11780 [Gammaproteobacteria bacterium]